MTFFPLSTTPKDLIITSIPCSQAYQASSDRPPLPLFPAYYTTRLLADLHQASQELHTAFNALVSSTTNLALLAKITNETLVPHETIPSPSSPPSFPSDLTALAPHLPPTTALYVLLKTSSEPNGYIAVTYVPDAAPVRQKMLFAATRLTLVRELGVERFRETLFVTTAEELSPRGWERHQAHGQLAAPLTEEERSLEGIREAEARESAGTGRRAIGGEARKGLNVGEGVLDALQRLESGADGTMLQIVSLRLE